MVPTRQGVLVVAAAVATAAAALTNGSAAAAAVADASAAAAVAREAAKPTAADDDDDADGLCRRACHEHCHSLRGSVEPRRRASGRRLAALHLWPGHGCRRRLRRSSSSRRCELGLPPGTSGSVSVIIKNMFFSTSKTREGHSGFDG